MPVTGSQRLSVQPFTRAAPPCRQARNAVKRHRCVLARAGGDDDEFEAKLKQLEKGQAKSSPRGKKNSTSKKRDSKQDDSKSAQNKKKKQEVDYSDERLWRETAPARGDLVFNVVMGATLVWLPLTASAIGRCAFVNYKITDKRIITETNAPWKKEESHIGYHEVGNIVGASRGLGAWGDMVMTLTSGEKLEMRSVPDWKEVRDYIIQRRNAIRGTDITAEELMGSS